MQSPDLLLFVKALFLQKGEIIIIIFFLFNKRPTNNRQEQ